MSHYFTNDFQSDEVYTVTGKIAGYELSLKTGPGMFSYKEFDEGTVIMLEEYTKWIVNNDEWIILDLCAGYGLVASYIKSTCPDCSVHGVEVNERACEFARQNLSSYGGVSDDVVCADAGERLEKQENTYDTILVNPPFSAGKKFCFSLIECSFRSLKKWGSLYLVAPTKKGAKSYQKKLEEVFDSGGDVKQVALIKWYRVYRSVKK